MKCKSLFKTLILPLVVLFACSAPLGRVMAQDILPRKADAKNVSGPSAASNQNLAVQSGGGLTVNGTLIVKKNLVDLNPIDDLGAGTIEFSGTTPQAMSGQNTIGNLVVNNAAGLDLGGNTTVNALLNLQNGHIRLGNYNLSLGNLAMVAGTPSASAMVVADGSGEFRKSFSGTGSFAFPVGDNTGTADYSPVALSFTAGTFSPLNYAGVKLSNSMYSGSTGNCLNRYWAITQSGITAPLYDAQFQYALADVYGNEADISCWQVEPVPAVSYNPANIMLHQLTASGLASFGSFTGAQSQAGKVLNLNVYLEGLYAGNGTMNKARNISGEQYSGNIADKLAVELHTSANYTSIAYSDNNVSLLTNGAASLSVPAAQSGSFYITIKHRNSVPITSKMPVSFAGTTVNYAFDALIKAYGDNLKLMNDGHAVVFGGDANQDGSINSQDVILVGAQASSFTSGYIAADCNGDGTVDAFDLILIDNNAARYVTLIFP